MFLHRYSSSDNRRRYRWMFVARVLVGRSAVGKRDYVRPPPIKADQPHGDLFDSCVNSLDRPTIFVVFDTDQCYPEYVIAYNWTWLPVDPWRRGQRGGARGPLLSLNFGLLEICHPKVQKFVEILSNLLEVCSHLSEICSVYQKLQLFALPKFLGSPKFVGNLFFTVKTFV